MELSKEFIETLSFKGLSPDEQETIINFGINDNVANIYTSDRTVLTKLKKCILQESSGYKIKRICYSTDGDPIAIEVEFPKEFVSLRTKKREISDEAKIASSERFKKMWEDKKVNT